jgi:DNA-directed RNA polymerase subunit M/transcription elongation factor TFIIS
MEILGPAGESLRLAEHYRRLTDEELIALAQHKEDLTELAHQALANEVSARRLTVPPVEATEVMPRPPARAPGEEDPYAAERALVEIRSVWSERDARRLQEVLDAAGIPFCMGLEKAMRVDGVTSNFANGVPVGVMQVGVPWAQEAMRKHYFPQDEPAEMQDDGADLAVHCPKCHSEDVVFEQLVNAGGKAVEKYRWSCGECGNEWEDEGVETG